MTPFFVSASEVITSSKAFKSELDLLLVVESTFVSFFFFFQKLKIPSSGEVEWISDAKELAGMPPRMQAIIISFPIDLVGVIVFKFIYNDLFQRDQSNLDDLLIFVVSHSLLLQHYQLQARIRNKSELFRTHKEKERSESEILGSERQKKWYEWIAGNKVLC